MYLKRATPQNITIGGLAGAIPPLLGWTAMTNEIHLQARDPHQARDQRLSALDVPRVGDHFPRRRDVLPRPIRPYQQNPDDPFNKLSEILNASSAFSK